MKITLTKRIGKKAYHFQCEGSNLFEVVREQNKLSFPDVCNCGICGSDNLELSSRKAKDKFEYVFVKCYSCSGELTFGQQMADKDIFYLRKNQSGNLDWKKLELNQNQNNHQPMNQGFYQ